MAERERWQRQVESEGLRLVPAASWREEQATAIPREESLWRGHSKASRGELDEEE